MVWNLVQQMQLRAARRAQHISDDAALQRSRRHDERADELEDELERLILLVEAMWQVCRDQLDVTDEELRLSVDATLRAREAAASLPPQACRSCGAAVRRDHQRCQFCGAATGRTDELFG